MGNEMLNIGNNNFLNSDKICLIISADAEKVRRIMKRRSLSQKSELFWSATGDSETRSLIVLDGGKLVTSSVSANSLAKRQNQKNNLEVKDND